MALFKPRAKRDEAQGAGSALALWQLDEPSTVPANGEWRTPAAPNGAQAPAPRRGRSEGATEPAPSEPASEQPLDKDGELAFQIAELEGRHADALERSERVLEDARRVLESMEMHAGEAESHSARATRLANAMSKYREQEAAFQGLIDKIRAAEERAAAADRRAREAMESIPERGNRRIAQ